MKRLKLFVLLALPLLALVAALTLSFSVTAAQHQESDHLNHSANTMAMSDMNMDMNMMDMSQAGATISKGTAPRVGGNSVTIQNFAFSPAVLTVTVGTVVTWTNQDGADHTVTSDDGLFDSGSIQAGVGTYSQAFTQTGTYPYHCAFHTNMHGTIVVVQAITNVNIQNFAFSPTPITVTVGTQVVWTNLDAANHTVTSDTGVFNSGTLASNATYSFIFTQTGSYAYHCAFHSGMHGTVVVVPATPTIASVWPPSGFANPGGDDFYLTVTGTNFINSSVLNWNGAPRPTTYINPTVLVATISATNIAAAGSYTLTVDSAGAVSTGLAYATRGGCSVLLVSRTTDDANCGSLFQALNAIVIGPNAVSFMPLVNPIQAFQAYTVNNRTLTGVCSPYYHRVIIDGGGKTGPGLTITGGSNVFGLQVRGYSGPQIKIGTGSNRLGCVKAGN